MPCANRRRAQFVTSTLCAASCMMFAPVSAAQVKPADPEATPPGTVREEVVASFPDDPRLDTAVTMLSRGAFEPAVIAARAVLVESPGVDRAAAILGIALSKSKRYEEARGFLERARDSSQPFPERKHAAHFLGWCCYHIGDLDAARKAFEQHLTQVPDEPDSTFGLGLIALAEDRLDDADKLFDAALANFSREREPKKANEAKVLTRKSDVALRRGEVEKAEALLERSVQASPVQHETWSKLARVRDRLGKTAAADAARANAERILQALGRKQGEEQPASAQKQPDGKPDTKPETKPETRPETRPETKPETRPETKPETRPETKP
jgi:predicted Zn-dependent protease